MKQPEAPAWLRVEANHGYGLLPLPSPRDLELMAWLPASTPSELGLLTADHHSVLRVFAERMASWAVRIGDRETLKIGLVALALAGLGESRDTLTILPLFFDAARRLGLDPATLFREVGAAAKPAAAGVLEGFLHRAPEDQSLEAMGYREGADAGGFRYERTW